MEDIIAVHPGFPLKRSLAEPIRGIQYSAAREQDYISLLLYIETLAVDHDGKVTFSRLNYADRRILEFWDDVGFIDWRESAGLVRLSADAVAAAHSLRRFRMKKSETLMNAEDKTL